MDKPYIVGITGGSASGKTSFLKKLLASFQESEVCLVSQDNYYKPRHQQPIDENGIENFDTPASIDFQKYATDLNRLKQGETVLLPEYTYNNPRTVAKTLAFKPAPIIVVEGIFVFYYTEIAQQLDLKIFIDAKEHIKLKRRIIRDKEERGYDLEDVLYRYERHVAPTYEKYIEPFKHNADLIVPNNVGFEKSLDIIVHYLRNKILSPNR
ncbi:MAG: uridine kinase [Bacteroidota bacterium]